jgi:cytochrome b pre-mRNA-processing protein 3
MDNSDYAAPQTCPGDNRRRQPHKKRSAAMFKSLFQKNPTVEAGEALYAAAAEQARATPFYEDLGVPDTVEGRFEMVTLHVWLVLRRLKGGEDRNREVAQRLFDTTFSNFDAALRELGVGDLIVGKKIRKLAENFYGRVGAYDSALKGGTGEMAKALARNVYASEHEEDGEKLAAYVRGAIEILETQPQSQLAGGVAEFPKAGTG